MDFNQFHRLMQKHIDKMVDGVDRLYVTDIDKDVLWDTYLDSFPPGTNKVFRERREFDCQCCRQFIRGFNVVAIKRGKLVTIWDFKTGDSTFQPVLDAMARLVKASPVANVFVTKQLKFGTKQTPDRHNDRITWEHFYYELPKRFKQQGSKSEESYMGEYRDSRNVLTRSLQDITLEAIDTALELISTKTLYRGDQWKQALTRLRAMKVEYDTLTGTAQELYTWVKFGTSISVDRIRNHSIGTLLLDISGGRDLNDAVKAYENIVAGPNYKRPKPIFTERMKRQARDTVASLGLNETLPRRHATTSDISVADILFVNPDTAPDLLDGDDIWASVTSSKPKSGTAKKFDGVQEIGIDQFITNVLPTAQGIEVMVENRHIQNFTALLAPVHETDARLFAWDNLFTWAYTGNMADSDLTRAVQAAGGRTDGVLRFSHSWNHTGQNQSLMDLHVFFPGYHSNHGINGKTVHDTYPKTRRVGWNQRRDHRSGATQDVDFVNPPGRAVPVENITFPRLDRMPEGEYIFKIHNWSFRDTTKTGFHAEIAFGDELYQWVYDKPLQHKEWITLATVELKDGKFTMTEILPSTSARRDQWGIETGEFHQVNMMMYSPNYWEGAKARGQLHYMFMLQGCKSDETLKGFFNEHLRPELNQHRKVFEALGTAMSVEPADEQLAGLGFSSTKRNNLIVRVTGSTTRVLRVIF